MVADNSVVTHKRGKPIRSGERGCVLNVFNTLCQENPEITLEVVTETTSQVTAIGKASVCRIRTLIITTTIKSEKISQKNFFIGKV
jgi:hypothetical protein